MSLVLSSLCVSLLGAQAFPLETANGDPGISFTSVASRAGITTRTIYGDEHKNKYLLETTGCGAAFLDYDNDGWEDILLVNGARLGGPPHDPTPATRL
ncbi:MAG TPA: CRTAC1 family protein, partial [Blastocatellia bacterium]|nr:CRTAC1 family protein [Blastocatellia bacterium]